MKKLIVLVSLMCAFNVNAIESKPVKSSEVISIEASCLFYSKWGSLVQYDKHAKNIQEYVNIDSEAVMHGYYRAQGYLEGVGDSIISNDPKLAKSGQSEAFIKKISSNAYNRKCKGII